MENHVPCDDFCARVNITERGTYSEVKRYFLPTLCNHCEKAPCVEVCLVKASYKREDGVVLTGRPLYRLLVLFSAGVVHMYFVNAGEFLCEPLEKVAEGT